MYMYMNNHVHGALQSIEKEIEKEERNKHKSSSHICTQQPQRLRKIEQEPLVYMYMYTNMIPSVEM